MDDAKPEQNVLVLTDSPGDYVAHMSGLGLSPRYVGSVGGLLDHLLDHPASGFVLEVDKVMRAGEPERDQVFQLAGVFPVLRVLRKGEPGVVSFLDDPGRFGKRVQAFPPRQARHCGRVPVLLSGLLASGEVEGFDNPVMAHILDLSDSGGFVSCPERYATAEKVRLCIRDLEDKSPILSSIRWRKGAARAGLRSGFGLRFLDIRPGQMRELLARFLAPLSGRLQARVAASRA